MRDNTAMAGKCPFGFDSDSAPQIAVPAARATVSQPAAFVEVGGYRHLDIAPESDSLPAMLDAPVPAGEAGHATGRCLCGKVSFRANQPVSMVFASHDKVSRKRSGGVAMTVMLRAGSTAFAGWENLSEYQVSPREVSCFCRCCGTPVLSRYLAPDAMAGMISISAGLLDRSEGLRLAADICHDEKPAFYAFEGKRQAVNSSELEAIFAGRGR